MPQISEDHFHRAALEIGQSGENDTLPYDVDARFIKDRAAELAAVCHSLSESIRPRSRDHAAAFLNGMSIFSERLLSPSGSHGFRITTRIHPFWNLYLNGIGIALAEASEPHRSVRAHSYRISQTGPSIFDNSKSWRAYKEATLSDPQIAPESMVIQTDISSFYERIYHHRLQNSIDAVFGHESNISVQIDRILNKISSGRSFGLPIGGQCARILAEIMMMPIDESLTDAGLVWHRYVDDFTIICADRPSTYRALSALSHTLADYGLSLNRTKTTILSSKHYVEYIKSALGDDDKSQQPLRELDLHFDPYSDDAQIDYEKLKESVKSIDMKFFLESERHKTQPDSFIIAQISRALKFQDQTTALQICDTLLDPSNLDSFRSSFSKILRGINDVRSDPNFISIHDNIDIMLDKLPVGAPHLLMPEANLLHYLRAIRHKKTDSRGSTVRSWYETTQSQTVRRACIDCWRTWRDRSRFQHLRNNWSSSTPEEQRLFWLSTREFGEEGDFARKTAQERDFSYLASWMGNRVRPNICHRV